MDYNLEDKEETKEYLKNLGIEYRFGCFSEKQPESCQLLGEYLETIEGDLERAVKVYYANCRDSNVAKSCYRYAHLTHKGKGCTANMEEALEYYTRACSLGERMACTAGGAALADESGKQGLLDATRDDYGKRAVEMLDAGCSKGDGFACNYLSMSHIAGGRIRGVAKDMAAAFSYASKGCDAGHMYACANLSQMYARGDGTSADAAKAAELRKKADGLQAQFRESLKLQRVRPRE